MLWLEQFLGKYPGAVLAVTHDRYFLDNVAEWICEVDRGNLFPYKETILPTWKPNLSVSRRRASAMRN